MSGSTLNAVPFRSTIFYTAAGTPAALGTVFTVGANGIQSTTNALGLQSLLASTMTASTVSFSTMTASTILTQASTITLAQNVNVPNRFVEVGCDAANSMYFDFHSSDAALPDYSTRIISQGGATTGTGGLNMYASTIGLVATNGVGIGTTVPSAALHIKNATTAMRITGNLTNASTRPAVSTTPGAFEIRGSSASGDTYDDGFLRLSAGGGFNTNQQAYIDLSGYSTVADMDKNIVFGTAGVERMRITAAGNVGIGTTAPLTNFEVYNNGGVGGTTQANITSWAGGVTTTNTSVLNLRIQGAGGGSVDNQISAQYNSSGSGNYSIALKPGGTTVMTAVGNGNVGIGTTNPTVPLHVRGPATTAMLIQTTITSDMILLYGNNEGTSAQGVYVMPIRVGSTETLVGGIQWTGSAMAYNGTSDYRVKSNIIFIGSQLLKLRGLMVKEFNIFDSTKREVGFIAHELQEYYPNIVTGEKDEVDANGKPNLQQVNLQGLIPYMVKGIQELASQATSSASQIQELSIKATSQASLVQELSGQTAQITTSQSAISQTVQELAAENTELKSAITSQASAMAALEARLNAAGL